MATKRYLFPADYMADPSVHIFDGKIYIYPSHDWEASNVENDNGDQYIMKDYHVLSIDGDPMTGTVTDHGCVLRQEDIPWAGRQLWDCDVQEYEMEVPTNAEEQAAGMGYSKKVKRYIMYFPTFMYAPNSPVPTGFPKASLSLLQKLSYKGTEISCFAALSHDGRLPFL